jgi:hypothetical protein
VNSAKFWNPHGSAEKYLIYAQKSRIFIMTLQLSEQEFQESLTEQEKFAS